MSKFWRWWRCFLPTLSKLFSNVVSIDLEITEAQKICLAFNLENVDLVSADILSNELSDAPFDAIIAADVLEHFKNVKPAVKYIGHLSTYRKLGVRFASFDIWGGKAFRSLSYRL